MDAPPWFSQAPRQGRAFAKCGTYHPYPQGLLSSGDLERLTSQLQFRLALYHPEKHRSAGRLPAPSPLLYKVEKLRTVLLSEQGFHTKDYSSEAQQLQAVALVYTWHKIRPLETIEAFHNHRWIDAREEGGLLLGLRILGDAKTPYGERKFGWSVYQALNTPGEQDASAFAKELIGVTDFSQIPYRGPIPDRAEGR